LFTLLEPHDREPDCPSDAKPGCPSDAKPDRLHQLYGGIFMLG